MVLDKVIELQYNYNKSIAYEGLTAVVNHDNNVNFQHGVDCFSHTN